jgi:hypothetical protein
VKAGVLVRSLALGGLTFLLVWVVVGWLRHRDVVTAEPHGDETPIEVAANAPRGTDVTVRGYVFVDSHTGTLLCSSRTTDSRPACSGDVLTLADLDVSRLPLERAEEPAGGYDAWTDDQVVLLGTTGAGGVLVVKDVLPE